MTTDRQFAGRVFLVTLGSALALMLHGTTRAQEVLDEIEVVGQTPLRAGVDVDDVASNVQAATGEEISEQRAIDLAEFMRRNLAGVFVNEAQSNPLQPDVQYRGFVGSPLLGLPQGIAVYFDGVRMNEPFGDTVNWALLPDSAMDTVYLVPGSNPLFGLNALGGAVSINTKDGFSNPGSNARIYGGSFGRFGVQAGSGGNTGNLGYFMTASFFEEEGWRDFSPSEAIRLFGKLGWRNNASSLALGIGYTGTDLIGNGAAPVQLLASERAAIFTRPDRTENEMWLANLTLSHELVDGPTLTGNVYLRDSDVTTLNGDDSDFEACAGMPAFLCESDDGDETLLLDPDDNPIPATDALEGATVNRTATRQQSAGFGIQSSWTGAPGGRENLLVIGAAYDHSDALFDASTELGSLDDTRLAVPGGRLIGDAFTRLAAETRIVGVFVTDTYSLSDRVTVTVSGRYNRIEVTLEDQLGTALNGNHVFNRINPAAGVTVKLTRDVTAYAGYGEANRAPSPVELTCADEDDPCRLPNAFLADPPLEQVVARTWEAGIRGHWADGGWHAGVFRAINDDDILFISAGALTNEGYFDNVGKTRRDGIEIDLHGQFGQSFQWFLAYTYLDAIFLDNFRVPSANNPASIDGEVDVQAGDRLPLIPNHLFKAGLSVSISERLTLGGQLLSGSDFYLRGDEGNDTATAGDFAVLNLRGDYHVTDKLTLFLNIDNVLNSEYETFGLFGQPEEVLGEGFDNQRFLSPGAPAGAWLGLQLTF